MDDLKTLEEMDDGNYIPPSFIGDIKDNENIDKEEYWEDLLPEDQERELTKLEEEKIGYEFAQRANILYAMFKYREIMSGIKFNGVIKLWR